MNIQSLSISCRALATIIPSEPLASGDFQIGHPSKSYELDVVANQLYTIKLSALDAVATLAVESGILSGGGGMVLAGGAGEDVDCQPIDMADVRAIQLRNPGVESVLVEIPSWTGGDAPFGSITLAPGGEFTSIIPEGALVTAAEMTFTPSGTAGALELFIVGKS